MLNHFFVLIAARTSIEQCTRPSGTGTYLPPYWYLCSRRRVSGLHGRIEENKEDVDRYFFAILEEQAMRSATCGSEEVDLRVLIRAVDSEISRLRLRQKAHPLSAFKKRRLHVSSKPVRRRPKRPPSVSSQAWMSPARPAYKTPRRHVSQRKGCIGTRGRGRNTPPYSARELTNAATETLVPNRPASSTPKAWARSPRHTLGVGHRQSSLSVDISRKYCNLEY